VDCIKCGKPLGRTPSEIKYVIKKRRFSGCCIKCKPTRKCSIIPKTELINLYITRKLTSREISKIIGFTHRTILNWLLKYQIKPHDLKWRVVNKKYASYWKDKKIPVETRLKISATHIKKGTFKGSRNPRWNGGTSRFPYPFDFNNELKRKIFERDGFTCQACKDYSNHDLSCHHIDENKLNSNMENLVTLCRSCHSKLHVNTLEVQFGDTISCSIR